jgi:Carbohydrate binding domain
MFVANLSEFDGAHDAVPDGGSDANVPIDAAHDRAAEGATGAADASEEEALDDVSGGQGDVAPTDLIENPGFENGISPWTTYSDGSLMPSLATSTAHAHTGSYSGYVTDRTQTFEGTVQNIGSLVTQGHTYTASAWALVAYPTDGGSDAGVGGNQPVYMTAAVKCLVDGSIAVNYPQIASATATTTGWTRLAGTFVVPTCALEALEVYVAGPAAGVDLYVDDVSVLP